MGLLVRRLLICLLALAVTAQGVAAAALVCCGPNHPGGGSARVQTGDAVPEHPHHAHTASVHEGHASDSAAGAVADDVSARAHASEGDPQKCNACASCCPLGAMLSTVPVFPATDPAPTVFTMVVPTVSAFAVDGPERPPRSALA